MDQIDLSLPVMSLLKKETSSFHSRLESLDFFTTLMKHRLPLECYVFQLKALSIVHGVLENELAVSENEIVAAVWDDELRKLPFLEQDLVFLAPRVPFDHRPSVEAALAMAEKIRLRAVTDPVSLLGYLYTLEGSTLGNSIHQADIQKSYAFDDTIGHQYYASYGDAVGSRWKQFTGNMNQLLTESGVKKTVLDATFEAFAALETIYLQLFPLGEMEKSKHITSINPEAGIPIA